MVEFTKRTGEGDQQSNAKKGEIKNISPPVPIFSEDQVRQALVDITGITKGIETVTPRHQYWLAGVQELMNRRFFQISSPFELSEYFLTTYANERKPQPVSPSIDLAMPATFISRLVKRTDQVIQDKVKQSIINAIDSFDVRRDPSRFEHLILLVEPDNLCVPEAAEPLIKKIDSEQSAMPDGTDSNNSDIQAYKNTKNTIISVIAGLASRNKSALDAIRRWFNDDNFDPSESPVFVSVLTRDEPDSYPELLKRMYERVDTMEGEGPDVIHFAPAYHASVLGAKKTAEILPNMDGTTMRRFLRDVSEGGFVDDLGVGDNVIIDKKKGEIFPVVTTSDQEAEKVREAFGIFRSS